MAMHDAPQTNALSKKIRVKRKTFLPFALPHITQAEIDEVVDTLRSGWLTAGPKTKRFEHEFAAAVGASYAVAVNSATAALHLALEVLGIGAGDEVIVPVYTFTSTASVIIHCGATPVFVDVNPDTYNLNASLLEAARTERTRAIMVVHIAGLPAAMDEIQAFARRYGLPIVEDAAHAFPSNYRGKMIGTIGDITAFSFYATKTLATGDGGMLTTENPEIARRAAMMALHGISRDAWKRYTAEGSWYYEVLDVGYKYNMTDIAAALGLRQLERRQWLYEQRKTIAQRYNAAFAHIKALGIPPDDEHVQHAWHLYPLRLYLTHLCITRGEFIEALKQANIGSSVHFIPLHLHPYYRDAYGLQPNDFPGALYAYEREVSLPIYPGMTEDDVEDVITAVKGIVAAHHR